LAGAIKPAPLGLPDMGSGAARVSETRRGA